MADREVPPAEIADNTAQWLAGSMSPASSVEQVIECLVPRGVTNRSCVAEPSRYRSRQIGEVCDVGLLCGAEVQPH